MKEKTLMRADEVSQELGVSAAFAYKLIRKLNDELEGRGYITIRGRVSRQFFMEKLYGGEAVTGKGDPNERV